MSWFNRRFALLGLAALAAGCGFSPVYGPGGSGESLRGSVAVAEPTNRNGFLFVAELEQRLGRNLNAPYRLDYGLTITTEAAGISPTGGTTRYTVLGEASYTLKEAGTDRVVASGTVDGFTGYSATGASTAIREAQEDATERLIVILADKLVTRLSLLGLRGR